MRIYLDLLPEEKKESIKRRRFFWLIIDQEITFFILAFLFLMILFCISLVLGVEIDSLKEMNSAKGTLQESQDLKKYEEKFEEINEKTAQAGEFQDKHVYWSQVLKETSQLVPDGVYLTAMVIKERKISLSGKARQRDTLLEFQNKLKDSPCLENVNMPLSNLVSRENVVFQIDINVKADCLKRKI